MGRFSAPALAVLALAATAGQPPPQQPAEAPEAVFRAETNLALVRFHVVHKDRYVLDLRPEDIELLEDGKPVKSALFSGPGDAAPAPVEILLLLDVSNSVMNVGLLDTFVIKESFLDGLGPHVSVGIYAFGRRWKVFTRPTRDPARLRQALEAAYQFGHGGTWLYESIIQTARSAAASPTAAMRLMVILSDGFSTTKTRPEEAVKAANSHGIPLYPVILGHDRVLRQMRGNDQAPWPGGGRARARIGYGGISQRQARAQAKEEQMMEFAEIGEKTGGRSFDLNVTSATMLRAVFQSLVNQVRCEYVAGYYPAPAPDGLSRPRRVQVRLLARNKGKLRGGSRIVVR